MNTRITEMLGIEYPIIQGGMAWVAEHNLAAAVSEAGGLGLIGGANAPGEVVREEIRKARELTKKPFGVNVMLLSPHADDVAKVVVEEGIKVVTTGAGNPEKYMDMWKAAGVKVIPVVASVALARRMETASATCGTKVMVVSSPICPPDSIPSATTASAPYFSIRFANATEATTGITLMPAAFHISMYFSGLPAPVVTTLIPSSTTTLATSPA